MLCSNNLSYYDVNVLDRSSAAPCEDPMLWESKHSSSTNTNGHAIGAPDTSVNISASSAQSSSLSVLHLLCHHNEPQLPGANYTGPAGVHAFSNDGGTTWSKPVPAYGNSAELTNGTTLHFVRRERPWLLFDEARRTPTHLLNGVSLNRGDGFSWTFVQPLHT
jgi:hypothetical protein